MLHAVNHLAMFAGSVFIFLNTKTFMDNVNISIEAKTDKHLTVEVDVVQAYGGMNKNLKFVNIHILCG